MNTLIQFTVLIALLGVAAACLGNSFATAMEGGNKKHRTYIWLALGVFILIVAYDYGNYIERHTTPITIKNSPVSEKN